MTTLIRPEGVPDHAKLLDVAGETEFVDATSHGKCSGKACRIWVWGDERFKEVCEPSEEMAAYLNSVNYDLCPIRG